MPQFSKLKRQVELHLQLQAALYPLRKAVIFPLCFQFACESGRQKPSFHVFEAKASILFSQFRTGLNNCMF